MEVTKTDKMNYARLFKNWYCKNAIIYEIVYKSLMDRETVFLKPKFQMRPDRVNAFRCLKIYTPAGLNFFSTKVIEEQQNVQFNLYYSLAKYEGGLPDFGGVLQFRKDDIEEWNEKHINSMVGYDCLIDIDGLSHKENDMQLAKLSCLNIMGVLDEYCIPYSVRYSGMGYHILIPYEVFKHRELSFDPDSDNNTYLFYESILHLFHDTISELVDLDIHDSRRITKTPYSLVFYKDSVWVCWPFKSKKEFYNHQHTDYQIRTENGGFHGFENCFKRGIHYFNKEEYSTLKVDEFVKKVCDHEKKEKGYGESS